MPTAAGVYELVKNDLDCKERGTIQVRAKGLCWPIFWWELRRETPGKYSAWTSPGIFYIFLYFWTKSGLAKEGTPTLAEVQKWQEQHWKWIVINYVPLYTHSADRKLAANTAMLIKTYFKPGCFSNKFIVKKISFQLLLLNENDAIFILSEKRNWINRTKLNNIANAKDLVTSFRKLVALIFDYSFYILFLK